MVETEAPIYTREPLETQAGIPVFSVCDGHVAGYIKSASGNVTKNEDGGVHRCVDDRLRQELDASTGQLVERYVSDGERVLDIGVGLSSVLESRTKLDRHGIDISFDSLARARDKGFKVALSRIEDMPYPDNYFDALIACNVLEHVIDLNACCLQLLRVLKPGGTLIVRVPFKHDLDAYLDEDVPVEFLHVRSFDVAALRIWFGRINGMRYREHTFAGRYLNDARLKMTLLPNNSKVRQAAQLADSPDHPLWLLKKATAITQDEFRRWLYKLRDTKPKLLEEIFPEMAEGLDVNIVFTK